MYEENNYKIKVDWKSLLLKLALIIIVILLIIWLFPMPKLDTFYNRIFNDNLNTMKDAAENYFVGDKLPSSIGESTTLKLQDMLDKKLVTNFTDKNNNACSTTNSYAQVSKTEANTYVLKVQLSCDDKTDYILENINTVKTVNSNSNNVVNNNNSNNNITTNNNSSNNTASNNNGVVVDENGERVISKSTINNAEDDLEDMLDDKATYDKDGNKIEYEYKKAITKTTTSYTCPAGYVKDNNVCYKYDTGETIPATALYFDDVVTTTPAKVNTTGSYTKTAEVIKEVDKKEQICPEGYTLNDNICYKYVNVTVVPGTTTYSCPDDSYTLNGTTCTKTIDATSSSSSNTEYYCTEGKLEGTKCVITKDVNTSTTPSTTNYTCPSGGTLSGTTCTITKNATPKTTAGATSYYCPNGGSLSGTSCKVTNYANKTCSTSSGSYYCPNGGSLSGSRCTTSATYHAAQTSQTCPGGYSPSGSSCVKTTPASASVNWSNPTVTTSRTALSTYNNGSSKRVLANKSCTLTGCTYTYYTYTATTTYSCPGGYTRNGSTCYAYANKVTTTTRAAYYTCNVGSLSGSSCVYNASYRSGSTTCKCPSGYSESGSSCVKTTSYAASKTTGASTTTYSCPAGYTLNGTKCTKSENAKAITTDTQYTCPSGYVQSGTTCYQYTKPTEKITYKYSCPSGFLASGIDENMTCTLTVPSTSTYYCENADETLVGDKCTKTVKGSLMGYTCPSGYTLNGTSCVKKSLICMPAQEITNTEVKYEYKWSTESSLEGWTQTGKTRGISIYSSNYEK